MKSKLRLLAEVAAVITYAIALWWGARSISKAAAGIFPHSDHLVFALVVCSGVMLALACLRLSGGRAASLQFRPAALLASAAGFAGYTITAVITLGAAALIGVVSLSFPGEPSSVFAGAAALLVLVLLSEALPEELLFRGWLSERLRGLVGGPWLTIMAQAGFFTLFAVAVGAVASASDAGFIATFGVVLGMLRAVTGTVWVPVGFHLAFMTAQQSSAPKWSLIMSNEPQLVQVVLLTMIPFTVVIALLFDRVKRAPRTATPA